MDKQIDQKRAESGTCLFRRLIRRQVGEGVSSDKEKVSSNSQGKFSETLQVDASREELVSTRGVDGDTSMASGEYVRDNNSLLSLQPWIFRKRTFQDDGERMKGNGEFSDNCSYGSNEFTNSLQPQLSPRNVDLGYGLGRGQSSIRNRRSQRYSVKHLTSMENSLIPQLYKEHFEIEEFVYNSLPFPTAPTVKPFLVTDGKRIISKSSYDHSEISFENGLHREVDGVSLGVKETVTGVTPLPELRKPKRKSREIQRGRSKALSSERSHRLPHSQGSLDGMLLFCLGIRIGLMSTVLSNKREVEKLNNMLRNTENLVQDLQEELEMKDSLTVKELTNEACKSQEINASYANIQESMDSFQNPVPTSHFPAQERKECDQPHVPRAGENSKSLSKIEAELEAELERLELNMNACSLEGRMAALSELDPDLIADVVQGELKAGKLNHGVGGQADSKRETSGTSTTNTHNADYAVSPKELSLRLHEVIQFRQEERIKELERELLHSQKQLRLMESEQVSSERAFSNSDIGSSSNQESPTVMGHDTGLAHPFCLNLSGDALDAYDEAYEEFMRMAGMEENPPSTTNTSEQIDGNGLCSPDQSLIWGLEGCTKCPRNSKAFERESTWEQILMSRGSNDADESYDDNDEDDEEGKMLIQQIVERTRQGSPVVINAQRMLFSMDE